MKGKPRQSALTKDNVCAMVLFDMYTFALQYYLIDKQVIPLRVLLFSKM